MAEVIREFSKDTLLYVTSEDGSSKGWRVDLLVDKFFSKLEEKLLLCSSCNGLVRDACVCNGSFMCQVCIPEGTVVQPVVMNREIVNEKMVICLFFYPSFFNLVYCVYYLLFVCRFIVL